MEVNKRILKLREIVNNGTTNEINVTDSLPLTKLLTLEKVASQIRREG